MELTSRAQTSTVPITTLINEGLQILLNPFLKRTILVYCSDNITHSYHFCPEKHASPHIPTDSKYVYSLLRSCKTTCLPLTVSTSAELTSRAQTSAESTTLGDSQGSSTITIFTLKRVISSLQRQHQSLLHLVFIQARPPPQFCPYPTCPPAQDW